MRLVVVYRLKVEGKVYSMRELAESQCSQEILVVIN